jgi:hypothetical protein
MKLRAPTRALARIYVRAVTGAQGKTRYEARIYVPGTGIDYTCVRDDSRQAVRCVRKKAGIRA